MAQRLSLRGFLCGCLVLGASAVASAQTTWYVDVQGTPPGTGAPGDPYTSIQYAISRPTTVAGDTVLVAPGTYAESLVIHKSITVRSSQGPLATTILPNPVGDGIDLAVGLLEGFTVRMTGGFSAIYVSNATLRGCIVRDCASVLGVDCTFARVESCTVVRNRIGISGQPYGGKLEITNTISWANHEENLNPAGAQLISTYNAGFSSSGGVPGDPGLWNLAQSDVHLRPGSPCIDAGDPNSPPDPDGTRRDIGAVVYDPTYAPAPTVYCTGKLNSQGCVPAIGASGSASATSPAPFTLTASQVVENKVGLLILGFEPQSVPFQGGLLCVQAPQRLGVQGSGSTGAPCSGAYALDMRAAIQSGAHAGLVPGALVYCQWWGRDLHDPAGFATSLSDALAFGIAP